MSIAIVLLFALLILGRFSAQGKSINQNVVAPEDCAVQGSSTR